MWANQLQLAFAKAAGETSEKRWQRKVLKAADKQRIPLDVKPSIKLSYRTAQKLKAVGVL